MKPERIAALCETFPWMPADLRRLLASIEPGRTRYGVQWFDGPQRPEQLGGAAAAQAYPSAWWIGRRKGNPVGYELPDAGQPQLCEWGGSQRRCVARYADLDALILAQINPDGDRRRLVPFYLHIPGLAFGPWRDGGVAIEAPFVLSAGRETDGIRSVLACLMPGWELLLMAVHDDAGLLVRKEAAGYELCEIRHGSFGSWQAATYDRVFSTCMAMAPGNGGADFGSFGRLTVPAPPRGSAEP